jgi:hypothetical protein
MVIVLHTNPKQKILLGQSKLNSLQVTQPSGNRADVTRPFSEFITISCFSSYTWVYDLIMLALYTWQRALSPRISPVYLHSHAPSLSCFTVAHGLISTTMDHISAHGLNSTTMDNTFISNVPWTSYVFMCNQWEWIHYNRK